jgi:phosphoribosylformylglycinamidine cyclo-ligase
MGHRMEIYLPEKYAGEVVAVSELFGIEARVIGFVEASDKEELVIESENGEFKYFL